MKDETITKEELRDKLIKLHQEDLALKKAKGKYERMENGLKKWIGLYKDLVEKAGIAILIDDKKGNFTYFNKTFASLFGYSMKEMKTQAIHSLVYPDDVAKVMKYHEDRLKGKKVLSRYEFRGVRKDGSVMNLEVDAVLLKKGKNNIGTRSYIWNITQRKRVEKELEQYRNNLEKLVEERTARFKKTNEQLRQEIFERKRVEEELNYRAEFERLITIISTDFINLPSDRVDNGINRTLQAIGEFACVDRSYVFLHYEDGMKMGNTHEWCAKGIMSQMHRLQGLSFDQFPWASEKVMKGEILHIPRVADLPPDAHAEKREFNEEGIQSLVMVPMTLRGTVVGTLGFDSVRKEKIWSEDDISLLKVVGGIFANALERKRAEETLKEAEEWQRSIFEGSRDAIFIVKEDTDFVDVNEAAVALTGYSREDLKEMKIPDLHDLEDQHAFKNFFKRIMEGEAVTSEAKIRRKDAIKVDVEFSNKRIIIAGKYYMHSVARDITERKAAKDKIAASLKEKEVLLREIHHRVKNNMQIISSLLRLQSVNIKSKKMQEMFKESQNRIRSMALIHEKLYKSEDFSRINFAEYIRSLSVHLFHTYQVDPNRVRLKTSVMDIFLDINMAIPCALIINELVSNSIKYAFPEGKRGEIGINFGSTKIGKFELVVNDDGVGFPETIDFRNPESLGLQIVNDLVKQLEGTIDLNRKNGTRFKVAF